jgi:excinuclease ABC B subunit
MPRFELVSEFRPMGDQPQAIAQLVDGINKGMRHQTLLGATGTGKSLGYDDPIFVVEDANTGQLPRVVAIGQLIDGLFEHVMPSQIDSDGDTEILDAEAVSTRYYAQAFDPQTCAVGLYPVRSFIRHQPPSVMYHLQTACGRSATLTGDHNLWVLRDGSLQLIKTADAKTTDYIPLPDTLLADGSLKTIDTLAILSGKRLFVEAPEAIMAYSGVHGMKMLVRTLHQSGITAPYEKASAIRHSQRGRGIEVRTFQNILAQTDNLGGYWNPEEACVGGKKAHNRLPGRITLTPEILRLFGYYIAEGNHQRGYIILANRDQQIRADIESALSQLGIPFTVRHSSDYQVSSTALAELFTRTCGSIARDKHLPEFWSQLSDDNLGHLLRAYFDGDGTVGRASDVIATTASNRLASDLAYALLRFGIWARITRRWKRATNTDHQGDWYYYITLSGQANLRQFQQKIGFGVQHKREALQRELQRPENSNVDIVPIDGSQLRWLRKSLGLTAKVIAKQCDISRSGMQFVETGKRSPQRRNLCNLLNVLRSEAEKLDKFSGDWQQVWQHLNQLCQLRWTPVKSVERVAYERPYVYDFCVPGVENFLAGSGGFFVHNTYSVASVVQEIQKPTLVMAHNKTLAAQLYAEFKEFFPRNAVEYFVSYYDYYQPEAYVPRHDLYIEKEADINDEIERLRLAATAALLSRSDVLIVASVSCIYGLGRPDVWRDATVTLHRGETIRRDKLLRKLVSIQYDRNDLELKPATFRVRGDTLEIGPAYGETGYRITMFGDEIERMVEFDPLTGELINEFDELMIFPAAHYIADNENIQKALHDIERELEERLGELRAADKLLEAQRLEQRTNYDLEMMREVGYCSGIENYSRHLDQRAAGSAPWTLLDYFPDDYLLVIDESHMSIPQVRGMSHGDRSRKETLIDYGFRLPSALDNRPLTFEEFEARMGQAIYTSATPGPYELKQSQQIVQQVIRPTGLVDPEISVRPVQGQVDDLLKEIHARVQQHERVLVTTLTKRMAEDLSEYLIEMGIRVHYLHSEIETLQRVEILRDLRLGVYDVVVGINLLREGLDLPEVSLVAILDADKEGFLRSEQALIQTIGRAARHINGKVIMYADKVTDSMRRAIDETDRRRTIQETYNKEHNIKPASVVKQVRDLTDRVKAQIAEEKAEKAKAAEVSAADLTMPELDRMIRELEKAMKAAAKDLEFEKAAALRDQVIELRRVMVLNETPQEVIPIAPGVFDEEM